MHRWFFGGLMMIGIGFPGLLHAVGPGPPMRTLIDVRTTHSDGAHDMDALVGMAKARGIQALAFVDHGRKGIRFGIEPIPQILGYTKDFQSLYTTGLSSFFTDLNRVRHKYPDMTLFAGTESIAGYTWSGIPFKNLSLHNSERMFITLGEEHPSQIESLPSYVLENARGNLPVSIAFWTVFVFILMLILLRRRHRGVALLLMASFIVFLVALLNRPVVDEDADLISAAHKQGLFVAWAYPGTKSGVRPGPMGVLLNTPPYSKRVFRTPTADGFAAVYGDTDTNTEPGDMWDQYMLDYMQGLHAAPIWGIAAGDFHEQGDSGEHLGNFPMDVWADAQTPAAILAAMRKGHMVAWQMPQDRNLRVKSLFLEDAMGRYLLPGDEKMVPGQVTLHCSLREDPVSIKPMDGQKFRVQIVVDGHILVQPLLGLAQSLQETLQLSPGAHVIRLRIPAQYGVRMEANPFMVHVP